MNTTYRLSTSIFNQFAKASISFIIIFISHTSVAADYTVTEIGTLGGNSTNITGLNQNGLVVGHSQAADGLFHAITLENGVMTNLETTILQNATSSTMMAVNDNGQFIGAMYLPPYGSMSHFFYDGETVINLSQVTNYAISTVEGGTLTGLNNLGQITGVTGNIPKIAKILTPDGAGGYSVEIIGYPDRNNWALGINDNRDVVGMSRYDDTAYNMGFIYGNNGLSDIGTLGGTFSLPYSINENGEIVGYSFTGTQTHGFLYSNGSMIDLGTLGGTWSYAYGINDLSEIVGTSSTVDYKQYATIYRNNTLTDLNTLIDPASGWVLTEARFINNRGDIVGKGKLNGVVKNFIMSPVNEAPVADAGGPYSGDATTAIQFDGSASSDPENNTLTYSWDFGDGNVGTGATPQHAYANTGTYTVTLVVNDRELDSEVASTTVNVSNHAPVADAGGDFDALERDIVELTATASYDPNGSIVAYQWTKVSGIDVKLDGSDTPVASFRVTNVKAASPITFELMVTDNEGAVSFDTVTVTILPR